MGSSTVSGWIHARSSVSENLSIIDFLLRFTVFGYGLIHLIGVEHCLSLALRRQKFDATPFSFAIGNDYHPLLCPIAFYRHPAMVLGCISDR